MIRRSIIFVAAFTIGLFGNRSFAQTRQDTSKDAIIPNYDVVPEFPGGVEAFHKFVQVTLKKIDGVAGKRVIVTFIVEKDGSLTDITVVRGINEAADKEALRVIKLSPNWKWAAKTNLVHRVAYSVPITFN